MKELSITTTIKNKFVRHKKVLGKIENYSEGGSWDGAFKIYNKDGKLIEEFRYQNGYI